MTASGSRLVTAAALALRGGIAVQEIDTAALVSELTRQGVHGLAGGPRA